MDIIFLIIMLAPVVKILYEKKKKSGQSPSGAMNTQAVNATELRDVEAVPDFFPRIQTAASQPAGTAVPNAQDPSTLLSLPYLCCARVFFKFSFMDRLHVERSRDLRCQRRVNFHPTFSLCPDPLRFSHPFAP
jgi:hypothetical protein